MGSAKNKRFLLHELTWPEAEDAIKRACIVIVPIGSIEQQGLHLPLGADSEVVYHIAIKLAEKALEKGLDVVVTPPLYYGYSQEHMDYPGTISLRAETLISVLYDICASLIQHGAKRILILNGHGGNKGLLDVVSRNIGRDFGVFVFHTTPFFSNVTRHLTSSEGGVAHAGELMTSCMLAIRPELVKMDKAIAQYPKKFIKSKFLKIDTRIPSIISFGWFHVREIFTDTGTVGDPTFASQSIGKTIIEEVVHTLLQFLEELNTMDLYKKEVSQKSGY